MQTVPTQPVASQGFQITLGGQQVALSIFQTNYGLFMNVVSNTESIVNGVLCEDRNRIVRDAYHGFVGDFEFIDTQGAADPVFTGLGSRFLLVYLEAADI